MWLAYCRELLEGEEFVLDAFVSQRFDEAGIQVRLEVEHMITVYPETTAEDTVGITKRRTAPFSSRCVADISLKAGLYSSGNRFQVACDKSRDFASPGQS